MANGASNGSVRGTLEARHGISSLLDIAGAHYLVDFGMGVTRQLTLAVNPDLGPSQALSHLAAGFITHLHSDHVVELSTVGLAGYHQGWPGHQVPFIGPGSRRVRTEAGPEPVRLIGGTSVLVTRLSRAFEADLANRVVARGAAPLEERWVGVDVDLVPSSDPVTVFEDDRVRVTAVEVTHGGMRPALAYRFDVDDYSVVFSGDTSPCGALEELAAGADVLVHEAIDASLGEVLFGHRPWSPVQEHQLDAIMDSHTRVDEVGRVAERAGVDTLVLSHLVPGSASMSTWERGRSGYSGRFIVGTDLQELPLGRST